jgi:hypothetical protein
MHDIYDPPPAPIPWTPPKAEPLTWTTGDLACLVIFSAMLCVAVSWAWALEPSLALWVGLGGLFVILESWFSALTFLHRHPSARPLGRWMVFLAALVPWMLGLGFAAALMMGLFAASDWAG